MPEPGGPPHDSDGDAPRGDAHSSDWRVLYETELASDVPVAFPGGPEHKAGAKLVAVTLGPRRGSVPLGFTTPSSAALALHIAARAAQEAESLRAAIEFTPVISPWGNAQNVSDEATEGLFDFFERAFVVLAFSYQAVESLANDEIQRVVTSPVRVNGRRGWEDLNAEECERNLSTADKISVVLPGPLGLGSPQNRRWWPRFRELERLRNESIHLKAHRAYPRSEVLEASIFHDILAVETLGVFPKTTVDVAEFLHEGRTLPRWLHAGRRLVDALA